MPAFIIISGVFYSLHSSKLNSLSKVIVPFIVYSVGYELIFYMSNMEFSDYISNFSPVWIMWYLYSLIIWRLVTPAILKYTPYKRTIIIVTTISFILLSLDVFGYTFGLARTIYFYPMFLFGYMYRSLILKLISNDKFKLLSALAFITILLVVVMMDFDYRIWFGSYNMIELGYSFIDGITVKFLVFFISIGISLLLFLSIFSRECFLTRTGNKTLYIYLMHGILIRLYSYLGVYDILYNNFGGLLYSLFMLFLAFVTTYVLSTTFFSGLHDFIFKRIFLFFSSIKSNSILNR